MVLLNNPNSCRQELEDGNQNQTKKQMEDSFKYSSDFELELPKHFGKRSNTTDSLKEDLDDCQPLDNHEKVQPKELQNVANDVTVPIEAKIKTHPALDISKNAASEVDNPKEIPKKRYF